MKHSRRNPDRLTKRRQAASRSRRLFFERFEDRTMLAVDFNFLHLDATQEAESEGEVVDFGNLTLVEPPSSYHSDKVSDGLTRVLYEYDLWSAAPDHGDFRPTDPLVRIDNGRVLLEAITTSSADELAEQLRGLGAEVIAVGSPAVSAWLPILRIRDLGAVPELTFAKVPIVEAILSTTDAVSQDVRDFGVLPGLDLRELPVSYRSDRVSDLLAMEAFEYDEYISRVNTSDYVPRQQNVRVNGARILTELIVSNSLEAVTNELKALGSEIVAAAAPLISAWIPLPRIRDLTTLTDLLFAKPLMSVPLLAVGAAMTQGDAVMNSDDVRSVFGLDGTGQKVGVISDSYNRLNGANSDIASGDIPGTGNPFGNTTPVQVVSELPIGSPNFPVPTDEGRAMLQIVHDVAPKAQLAFATAHGGKAGLKSAIISLQNAGANVIVDDILYVDEPMFMDGLVAQAADAAVTAGVSYVSAAGNSGSASYEVSTFVNSGVSINYGRGFVPLHDFDPGTGTDWYQQITIPANTKATFTLQWDDPFLTDAPTSGGATRDFDFLLFNSAATSIEAFSIFNNVSSTRDPVEFFTFTNSTASPVVKNIAIPAVTGASGRLKYVVSRSTVTINQFATNSPTSYGHANANSVLSVGAVNALASPPTLENFSSRGGVCIHLNTAGQPVSPPCTTPRQKPDVVGPDNVNTTFFGVDNDPTIGPPYDADSQPNFAGTSAAAPHVAAVVALLKQANPSASPGTLFATLRALAIDMNTTGYDNTTGFGRIDALEAAYRPFTPSPADLYSQ